MTDEEFMGKWFAQVTKPQLATYNQYMADVAPYRNSPKWSRMREFAQRQFENQTVEARQLYERAMADLAGPGEVSEETYDMIDAFEKRSAIVQIAAE